MVIFWVLGYGFTENILMFQLFKNIKFNTPLVYLNFYMASCTYPIQGDFGIITYGCAKIRRNKRWKISSSSSSSSRCIACHKHTPTQVSLVERDNVQRCVYSHHILSLHLHSTLAHHYAISCTASRHDFLFNTGAP